MTPYEWTAPTLIRFASEAVWDRATFDQLVIEWHRDFAGHDDERKPSRARTHRPHRNGRVPNRGAVSG